MGILGMHLSPVWFLWIWIEAIFLQLVCRFFPSIMRRKWTERDSEGKIVLITGANSGLGLQMAKEMAKRGATLILGVRNTESGLAAIQEIVRTTSCSESSLSIAQLDLKDLDSIRRCSKSLLSSLTHLDILINNAGISLNTKKRLYTNDGFEIHMGVNHLGHFLLTRLLLPLLEKGKGPRVINISSTGMSQSNLDPEDMNNERGWRGIAYTIHYANSKHASSLCCKELAERYPKIKVYNICPGFVKDTNLLRDYEGRRLGDAFINAIGLELEAAADIIMYCAVGKEAEGKSGQFFRFGRRWRDGQEMVEDRRLRNKVWNVSEQLVGLRGQN